MSIWIKSPNVTGVYKYRPCGGGFASISRKIHAFPVIEDEDWTQSKRQKPFKQWGG